MAGKYRTVLTQEDFAALVRGQAITKDVTPTTALTTLEIDILLSDIGFDVMLQEIGKAQND